MVHNKQKIFQFSQEKSRDSQLEGEILPKEKEKELKDT